MSFMPPLEGGEEEAFLDQCPKLVEQPDDEDYIKKLIEKERFLIRNCGGFYEYQRFLDWRKQQDSEERKR